jgi:hypothetical protein
VNEGREEGDKGWTYLVAYPAYAGDDEEQNNERNEVS